MNFTLNNFDHPIRIAIPAVLIFTLIFAIYSNTFNAGWHLDDLINILGNQNIQLTQLDLSSLKKATTGPFQTIDMMRPISYFSFAINWYIGKDHVVGYHIVNILIHFVSAFFLYLTLSLLFQTPILKTSDKGQSQLIALLGAALWAANPTQTQAVTYIVQRMASMAGMFYIASIFFYLSGRLEKDIKRKTIFIFLCLVSYTFAFLSKENTILLPGALLLIEILFFHNKYLLYLLRPSRKNIFIVLLVTGLILFAVYFIFDYFFQKNIIHSITSGYDIRNFSLSERILTQFRVLIYYLSQIFYPLSDRFSLETDITISTGLFAPITTSLSLLTIIVLLFLSVRYYSKFPIFSFSILFFFYNHLVESSVIPLELIFEHRNYIPSMFLFGGVLSIFVNLSFKYKLKRSIVTLSCISLLIFLFISSLSSYTRNWSWQTNQSLLLDSVSKAPLSARPLYNLALNRQKSLKPDLDEIFLLYDKASTLYEPTTNYIKDLAYQQMFDIAFYKQRDYQLALNVAEKYRGITLNASQEFRNKKQLTAVFYLLGRYHDSLRVAEECIDKINFLESKKQIPKSMKPSTMTNFKSKFLAFKGLNLLKLNKNHAALEFCQESLKLMPEDISNLNLYGFALSRVGDNSQANKFLEKSYSINTNYKEIYFLLIENNIKRDNINAAHKYMDELLKQYPMPDIFKELVPVPKHSRIVPPYDYKIIRQAILKRIENTISKPNSVI